MIDGRHTPGRVPVDLVPFSAGLPDCGSVNVGHALERVVDERSIKEVLVSILRGKWAFT